MKAFADDVSTLSLGDFTLENGTDRISGSGDLVITRDKAGLERARALKEFADKVVSTLATDKDLPDKVAERPDDRPVEVPNPFKRA